MLTRSNTLSYLTLVLIVAACCGLGSTQNATFDHTNWQLTLDRYLVPNTTINKVDGSNTFDYQGLRRAIALATSSAPIPFTSYLTQLAGISSLDDYSTDEQFAIFLNAYNAFAVNMVLQHPCKTLFGKYCWPIRSIRSISGLFQSVWDMNAGSIAGNSYTLNSLESKLRSMDDARIHACMVCASVSCPNLQTAAYVGSQIELQKNNSMQSFLANTMKGSLVDVSTATLTLNEIFEWFQSDFETLQYPTLNGGQPFGSVVNFVAAFSSPNDAAYLLSNQVAQQFFSYDWNLNSYANSGPPIAYA